MELHSAPRLSPEPDSEAHCERYLDRLPLSAAGRLEVLRQVDGAESGPRQAMRELHQALAGQEVKPDKPAYASVHRRLVLAYGEQPTDSRPLVAQDQQGRIRLVTTPPLNRTPMAPEAWPPGSFFRLFRSVKRRMIPRGLRQSSGGPGEGSPPPDPRGGWQRLATLRGTLLVGLVLAQTGFATYFMDAVLPYHGGQMLEIAILAL